MSGLQTGIKTVSAGYFSTCALRTNGGVTCWGYHTGLLASGRKINSSVPVDVDLAASQTVDLEASKASGSIARGLPLTFTATVSPVEAAGAPATVRFAVSHLVAGVWRQSTHKDLRVGATGRAVLRWAFPTAGSWYVRAQALANARSYRSSASRTLYYVVR